MLMIEIRLFALLAFSISQQIVCFCTVKAGNDDETALKAALKQQVRNVIGPFAQPKLVVITPDLPKTRSGKIMRRILRKVAGGEVEESDSEEVLREKLGDLSTLADPTIIKTLLKKMH